MGDQVKVAKRQSFCEFLVDYLEHSSFHGVRHLTRIRRNHPVETAFWSAIIALFVIFSSYNASIFWARYLTKPTVVTIDREYLNRNITFPPITLCHRNKLNETAMDEFLIERGFNASRRADPKLQLFMKNLAHFSIGSLQQLVSGKENFFDADDFVNILMRITNKLPHNITLTSNNEVFYFEPVLTDELGLCFAFNSRISSYLSPNFLVSGNLENTAMMKPLEELNYFDGDASAVCAGLIHNVDIYYHGPNDLPSNLRRIVNEDPEQKSYISLTVVPVMIKSQESVRDLFVFQRNCKFEKESNLEYFPDIYTQDLCRLDCRMRKFLETCNCLPFFYKRKGDDRQCNRQGLACIVRNLAYVDALSTTECSCLKDCNEIKYSVQGSNTMFWFHDSRVSWTMVQTKVIYKREVIHSFISALVSTGANLSLFVGVSALTFVEIIFFVYLRLKHFVQHLFA